MPSASHPSCILLQMIITCFLILDNGLPWWLSNKESTYNAGDMGREDPQGREMAAHSNSCLGNPMDRGACWALVQGVSRVRHDLGTKPPPPILRYLCRLTLHPHWVWLSNLGMYVWVWIVKSIFLWEIFK